MLKAVRYRIQNFRNIDDSNWIPLERVTAFVGRNESGKTALLKALHKFNPAIPEPYNAQREFPRDRFTREYKNGADWPVCSIAFEINDPLWKNISDLLGGKNLPKEVICTRYYDDHLEIVFEPNIKDEIIEPKPIIKALKDFASAARRLKPTEDYEEDEIKELRTELAEWATGWEDKINAHSDLRNDIAKTHLTELIHEAEEKAEPNTADIVEALQKPAKSKLSEAGKPLVSEQISNMIESNLPVFIYFENYGILDSAIFLPHFIDNLQLKPDDPRIRTINCMFKHVNLSAEEIMELGVEQAQKATDQGAEVTTEMIAQDQERKEERAIKLSSSSLDITKRFNDWYLQRRHTISYQADGNYFRIWVADDRRPGVEIELEGRSKGFQWFFSFYLVFLVESDEGHKNSVLLLDEPGLHLHPTAQQGLIEFFEKLAEKNQLIYSTHSPFLIDGEHIHRVRPVTEDDSGHSGVSVGSWPKDRETIFPLQAAAGYAMVRNLFQHKKNILVEGMSDYYYLHSLSHQCSRTKRKGLPDDIYITPCGGTKHMGHIASLFLGQEVRPLVILDGDDAGRARKDALIKELYKEYLPAVLMLDEVLGKAGNEVEIEDIFGEDIILPAINQVLGLKLKLSAQDRKAGSLPSQIKKSAERQTIELPDGWKASVAINLVSTWAEKNTELPKDILDQADNLFVLIRDRFKDME